MLRNHGTPRTRLLDNTILPVVLYLLAYGLLSLADGGMRTQPESVEDAVPAWLAFTWQIALAIGGPVAVYGCYTGKTRAESAGLASLVFALGVFTVAETADHWPVGIETALSLLTLLGCCLLRMRYLHMNRKAHAKVQRVIDHANGG